MARKIRSRPEDAQTAADEVAPARKVVAQAPPPPRPTQRTAWAWLDHVLPLLLGLVCAYLPYKVEPHIRDLFQLPKQMIFAEAAAWLVLVAGIVTVLGRPLRLPRTPMVWPGLVLMLSILGGVLIAPSQTGGVLSIFARVDAHRWVSAAVIFLAALVSFTRPQRLWYVLGGNLLGGVLVSLIGIGEQHNIRGLLPNPHWNLITVPGSTFGNRNMAAQEIVAVMPAAYAMLMLSVRWFLTKKVVPAIALGAVSGGALVTLLYFLVLAVTRSTWLGASAGLIVAGGALGSGVLWSRWRDGRAGVAESGDANAVDAGSEPHGLAVLFGADMKRALGAVAAVGVVVLLAVGAVNAAKPAGENSADKEDIKKKMSPVQLMGTFLEGGGANHYRWRFGMAESTVEAIKRDPIGGGAGNWRVIYPQYVTQREKNEMFNIAKQPIRAHNDFLQFGSEFGVHGLLALMTLLAMSAWLTLRVVRAAAGPSRLLPEGVDRDDAAWLAFCALSSLAAIVAICGDALASFPLQLPGPTFLFAIHLATIAGAEALLFERGFFFAPAAGPANAPNPPAVGYTVAALGLAGLFFLGPIYLVPGNLSLDTYRAMPLEEVHKKGLHKRWLTAELGFTDGRALQKGGRAQAGLMAIQRAIDLNPDDFQNHFIEGLNYNSLGQTKNAIASIENSLKLYPNLLNAWVNLAMFNRRLGDEKKMNEAIDVAIKLKPDELIALNVRAQWLIEKGKHEEVVKLLAPQLKPYAEYRVSPNWPVDDNGQLLGAWKTALGHVVTASRKLENWKQLAEALKLLYAEPVPDDPSWPEERKDNEKMVRANDLGDTYWKLGQWKEASASFQLAAELARSGHPEQKRKFGIAALAIGDTKRGAHELDVAVQLGEKKQAILEALQDLQTRVPESAAAVAPLVKKFGGAPAAPAPAAAEPAAPTPSAP